jgi:ComF family protein
MVSAAASGFKPDVLEYTAPPVRLAQLWHGVLDFCYPGACAMCSAFVESGRSILCGGCAGQLEKLSNAPACALCAMPAASDGAPCAWCKGAGIAHFDRIIRLGVFDDPLKHLIHQMKYHRRWPLGEFLADRLIGTERAKGLLHETQVLVPVPLHIRRHISRGYNQADVIAQRIGRKCRIPFLHAARRVRNTESQTQLTSQEQRYENVRGAFALRRCARQLKDKHVMVVDDVTTTGSTLRALAQVLKQAEPASLCAMVIAKADYKGRSFESI